MMQDGLRKSGIGVIGDVPRATHFCQFYQTKQDMLDILLPYFKAGLENNEACMWVTSAPLSAREAKRALADVVPDLASYINTHQIEIVPHNQWYLKDGYFDLQRVLNGWVTKLNQALARGYSGLRVTGNTAWLERKDWQSFTDYEATINSVIGKYNMLALCTYCLDECSAGDIVDVIRNHEFALIKQQGKWELIENAIYKQTREALQASEARLAHLASFPELNPMPIIELDMAGNISYMNPAAKALFPDMQAVGGKHPLLANWEALGSALQSKELEPVRRELKMGDVWYRQTIFYVPTSQSIRLYTRDITERKKADQLKDDFIGLVSHELRTPLTVIMGSLSTVLSESENLSQVEVRQLLQDAALETESMSHLVDNLLELSRSQSQQLHLYTEPIDIHKLVQNTLEKIRRQSSSRRFLTDIPKRLPLVNADSLRVERILYNLLDNAVKYSPSESRIKVTVRAEPQAIVIAVSDQGSGISIQDQTKLFGPFQHLEQGKLDGVKGAGFGLLVCRKLVEAHGGRIWVESKLGHGSTLLFTLPFKCQA